MTRSKHHPHSSSEWIPARIIEPLVLAYLTICILSFSFFAMSPTAHWLRVANLYDSLRPILRNTGVLLAVLETAFSIHNRKGPGRFLLYGIIGAGAISSWQQRAYGNSSNINSLLWMALFFLLFYNAVYHFSSQRLRVWAVITFMLILVVWCVACSLSLVQFALQIGNNGPNHSSSSWLRGAGFIPPRLTGVFGYPEYGAVFGVMVMMMSLYYMIRTRWLILRGIIFLCNLPIFAYIVLSGSRNAMVAMYAAVFAGSFLFFRKNCRQLSGKHIVVSLALSCLVLAAAACLYAGTKRIAAGVPAYFESRTESTSGKGNQPQNMIAMFPSVQGVKRRTIHIFSLSSTSGTGKVNSGTAALHSSYALTSAKANLTRTVPVVSAHTKSFSVPGVENRQTNAAGQKGQTPGLLDRQYASGDISTGRFKIWKDYMSIRHSFGLFGLSPENASFFIQEHYPDIYICSFIRAVYPERYEKGYVFHTHNGYLRVFVACGYVGLVCMLVFIFRIILTVISHIRRSLRLSAEFLSALLVVIVGASSALFDNEIFFNLNPTSLVFWIALSLLMRTVVPKRNVSPDHL